MPYARHGVENSGSNSTQLHQLILEGNWDSWQAWSDCALSGSGSTIYLRERNCIQGKFGDKTLCLSEGVRQEEKPCTTGNRQNCIAPFVHSVFTVRCQMAIHQYSLSYHDKH